MSLPGISAVVEAGRSTKPARRVLPLTQQVPRNWRGRVPAAESRNRVETPTRAESCDVDLVINCFERTYRRLLMPDAWRRVVAQHSFSFRRHVLLINNVVNVREAESLARALVREGACDRYYFVEEVLPEALARTGLRRHQLRRLGHFTDCCLAAVCLPGSDYLLYWDADARLVTPSDWITPSVRLLSRRPDVAICNPAWTFPTLGLPIKEAVAIDGEFALGYGFSDTAFLCRRSEFARPIYRHVAPASWRYPLSHIEAIFEQRADAYMRRQRRLRATYLPVAYTHDAEVGTARPDAGLWAGSKRSVLSYSAVMAARVLDAPWARVVPKRSDCRSTGGQS